MIRNTTSIAAIAAALLWAGAAAAHDPDAAKAADTSTAPADAPAGAGQTEGQDSIATGADDDVIVTGTRQIGTRAADSATPIKVLSADAIEHVGQPNLNQVLTQLVPSFTAEAFGGDTANLTLSARLRGLSPNHTLVLINGKRRHGTANLHVLGGPYQGGVAPDLDMIPPGAIQRIEVLEDGAAAQYGSDAIAGVINIILKDTTELSGTATAGQYYKSDGETYSGSVTFGTKFDEDNGYIDLTVFHRYHNFTQRGGVDIRLYNPDGSINPAAFASSNPAINAARLALVQAGLPGAPRTNRIVGDARSTLTTAIFNAGYDFGGVTAYTTVTYGTRDASAYENYRQPQRVTRSNTLGVAGEDIYFSATGFNPREAVKEEDFATTGGLKGDIGTIHWDISSTYGQDYDRLYTLDSANRSLFIATGTTPTNFYDGLLKATEWTNNLDLSNDFEVGMAKPMTIAAGLEYRENSFSIGKGDFASTYFEGGQSYPGFLATDAGTHKRHNFAAYGDVTVTPIEGLKLDGAVRYEDYSDFGTKVTWKGTGRYDFSSAFALRGTVSSGFRAPSLLEEYYSATNVGPTTAFVQLPPNSAAAKLLGYADLKPETSMNYSAGLVIRPIPKLSITIDAYQVALKNRIVGTGSINGLVSGEVVNQAVLDAIAAHGNILDPFVLSVGDAGVNLFTNGADTRTRGIDVTASYPMDFLGGSITWSVSGNYNETKITRLRLSSDLYAPDAQSILKDASPKYKVILGGLLDLGRFNLTARETFYGKSSQVVSFGGNLPTVKAAAAAITDLEAGFDYSDKIKLAIGANNLFNKQASTVPNGPGNSPIDGGAVYDAPVTFSPYGINGGYYYARISLGF